MSAANEGVLAWLDSLHETTADGALTNHKWPAAQEVRAAVAELIEVAKECESLLAELEAGGATNPELEMIRAALARCGVAK